MATIREIYFETLKRKESTYVTENVIKSLILFVNDIKDMNDLIICFDDEFKNIDLFNDLLEKVESGIPYQYLISSAYFYGLNLYVDKRVLIPRFETEELIHKLKKRIDERMLDEMNIADICTGSGCIAVALKKEFPKAKVYASDISKDALDVAKINDERYETNINFVCGDLCDPFINSDVKFDVLVANPPYIESPETVDKSTLDNEPHLALFANPNTKCYENILLSLSFIMKNKGLVAFEIEDDMKDKLTPIITKLLKKSSFTFEKDIYGHDRFLFIDYVEDNDEDLIKPASILRDGGIVCFPTETVMGLGVVYDNYDAYQRLNSIKNRPNDKPYTMMLDSYNNVSKYAQITGIFLQIVDKCKEFPMTFLLKKTDLVPDYVTHGSDIIGIRVPDFPLIQKLIKGVGKPLLVPSANKSGNKPALNSDEARLIFNEEVDYYINGKCVSKVPSTIIDLSGDDIKIIREGELTLNEIKRRLKLL